MKDTFKLQIVNNGVFIHILIRLIISFAGPHTLNFPWQFRIGSIGRDMFGATTKLADADADGNGEVRACLSCFIPYQCSVILALCYISTE